MLIVSNIVSLDGYVADEDGNSTALPMDEAFDAYDAERLRSADTLLVGANSYRGFAGFWPAVRSDPERVVDGIVAQARRHGAAGGGRGPDHRAGAAGDRPPQRRDRQGRGVRPDREDELGAWRLPARIVRRATRAPRPPAAGETLVFGSRTLWSDLLAAGLVDQLHLMVAPVVLGAGVPLRRRPPPGSLQLLGTRRFEGSQNVLLTYVVRPRSPGPGHARPAR